uniref:Potassium channel, subfamily K, member 5a n=1 Tax=Sinocyclocheilus anshuiensis TaxID=1608454 RepID=A0A671MCR7_9TELE
MSQEGWTYIEGLYFSFVTLTTIGFGDLVAGVDPNADYPTLYRYFVEVWIYLGLAWLSLFFNWKVRMVVEAHKALKKRRKRRKLSLDELQASHKTLHLPPTPNDVNIFSFLSRKKEDYNDLIKQIGVEKEGEDQCVSFITGSKNKAPNRSKSCSDSYSINGNYIISLDHSPRQKRHYSFSDRVNVALSKSNSYLLSQEECLLMNEIDGRITWDSKSYQTLMFPNANITFIDEENLLNNNLENDDNDFMPKFSTADETDFKEEQGSESETSVFTTDGSDHGHSYEQLVEEYSKEDNTDI